MSFPKTQPIFALFTYYVCFLLGSSLAYAQKDPQEEKKDSRSVRALILAPGSPNLEMMCVAGEKSSEPFNVGTSGLSQAFDPGTPTFSLAMKNAKSETGYRKVCEISLPANTRKAILLLIPAKANRFNIHLINDGEKSFGSDTTLFFNATAEPVGVILGQVKKILAPRKVILLDAPTVKGDVPFYQVQLFHATESGGSQLFASSRWLHREDGRNYVFIYQIPGTGAFTYKTFSETLSAQP